jgi:hypothetical protein
LAKQARHLREFVSMERQTDNKVFVVSLGWRPMVDGQTHIFLPSSEGATVIDIHC